MVCVMLFLLHISNENALYADCCLNLKLLLTVLRLQNDDFIESGFPLPEIRCWCDLCFLVYS